MPTYEYECQSCRRVFEIRQRISEPPLATCQECGGPVKRLLSPATFILKGGGWYVTDYPSEARKQAMKAESAKADSPKADSGSSSSKTESSTAGSPAPASSPPASKPSEPTSSSSGAS